MMAKKEHFGDSLRDEFKRQLRGFPREAKYQLRGSGREAGHQLGTGWGEEFARQIYLRPRVPNTTT